MEIKEKTILAERIEEKGLEYWKEEYLSASPFPHIIFDDFLDSEFCKKGADAFPGVQDDGWIHYIHYNEKKHGLNKQELIPGEIQNLIAYFNSDEFVQELSKLTGIENLKADPDLEGGGLHQSEKGGFLNVHADFTVHPHKKNWRRRVNLLLYFNEDWQEDYNGHLELWSTDMKECVQKVLPIFNRCVIFNTDTDSFHGVPEVITCPDNMSRKSLALYYFTEEEKIATARSTNYKARPGDGYKGIFIYLDKFVLSLYSKLKGVLGINDDAISRFLNKFNRR